MKKESKRINNLKKVDILDVLLDENNKGNIFLTDVNGSLFEFEQIAIIPFNDDIYAILKPATEFEGLNDDEAILFKVIQKENGESNIVVERDEGIISIVYKEYYKLLLEASTEAKDQLKKYAFELLRKNKLEEAKCIYEMFVEYGYADAKIEVEAINKLINHNKLT